MMCEHGNEWDDGCAECSKQLRIQVRLERYWINQPSSSQPQHKYHGMLVLASKDTFLNGGRVYITDHDDPRQSMEVCAGVLSSGWPSHLRKT